MLRKLFVIAVFFLFPYFTYADEINQTEHIKNFGSIVVVNKDASIDVTETLVVYATGNQIKHGIVRWLPLHYVDSYGVARHTNYQIQSIEFNNAKAIYHTQNQDGKFAIYIGDKNTYLDPGIYTYTIVYHVFNAINFFKDGAELYWNITGNGWTLPIDKVDAKIQLPAEANITHFAGYTGAAGTKGSNFIARKKTENQIVFVTTQALQPGEGLTVAVAWPKGIVTQPTWMTQLRQQLNPGSYILLFLNALVFAYLFTMWNKHGRDPQKGPIIPLFQPPKDLSPEAVRYINRMGFDMKTFSTAAVNLATQGIAKMNNAGSTFKLTKISDDTSKLPSEEKTLVGNLFATGSTIDLDKKNYATISKAKSELSADLAKKYLNVYFVTNTKYVVWGVLLTLVGFAATILFSPNRGDAFFAIAWLTGWTGACCFLLVNSIDSIRKFRLEKSITSFLGLVFSHLFLIPFLLGEVIGIYALGNEIPMFTLPLLFMLVIMNVVFYYLLRAPTAEGRKVMDEIEGFKMFLSTTEQDRLQKLNPPKQTPETFEKLLPYAIALDVENKWGENFNRLLREAGQEPSHYQPTWYTGSNPWSASSIALPVIIGTALASSLASASISSSASSGGGSSGGGGGGGGGGGW